MKHIKIFEDFKSDIKNMSKGYNFFHISNNLLLDEDGKTFTFTPRVPQRPFEDGYGKVIEDNFTKRISLAPTIEQCLDAIRDNVGYVYGININEAKLINLEAHLENCLFDDYLNSWYMDKWLKELPKEEKENIQKYLQEKGIDGNDHTDIDLVEHIKSPTDLPDNYRIMFFGCVPDCDKNNEYWSLKSIKMTYLGTINND